jgi:hypothetical protein
MSLGAVLSGLEETLDHLESVGTLAPPPVVTVAPADRFAAAPSATSIASSGPCLPDPAGFLVGATAAFAPVAPAPPKKRGPGRPSKAGPPPKLERHGIVAQPRYQEDILELGSEQPCAFKRLFAFFDKLKACQILIQGTPTGLNFYTTDDTELLRVRAEIQGAQMNHYYCGEEFWLSLNQAHVSKIFGCINKSFHRIRFIFRHTDRNVFTISLTDTALGKDNFFPITVNPASSNPQWSELERLYRERDMYRVSWTVPRMVFKKCHEIATQTAISIKVNLVAGGQLRLSYIGNGIQNFSETYQDSSKIKLRSLLAPGEVFAIDYSAPSGMSLSGAIPADEVSIFCTEKKPILFLCEDDEAGISVLTAMPPSDIP